MFSRLLKSSFYLYILYDKTKLNASQIIFPRSYYSCQGKNEQTPQIFRTVFSVQTINTIHNRAGDYHFQRLFIKQKLLNTIQYIFS